jgi:hypothetical protein
LCLPNRDNKVSDAAVYQRTCRKFSENFNSNLFSEICSEFSENISNLSELYSTMSEIYIRFPDIYRKRLEVNIEIQKLILQQFLDFLHVRMKWSVAHCKDMSKRLVAELC